MVGELVDEPVFPAVEHARTGVHFLFEDAAAQLQRGGDVVPGS